MVVVVVVVVAVVIISRTDINCCLRKRNGNSSARSCQICTAQAKTLKLTDDVAKTDAEQTEAKAKADRLQALNSPGWP